MTKPKGIEAPTILFKIYINRLTNNIIYFNISLSLNGGKFPLTSERPSSSNCKLGAKHQKFAGEAPLLAQEPCDSATELRILSIKLISN